MCEMMLKGSKEALMVCNALNAIYVEGVERGKAINLHIERVGRLCYVHIIATCNAMSKGSTEIH